MRKLTRKQQKLINKPWISRGILKSIKTKQKLYLSHFVIGGHKSVNNEANFFINSLIR